MTKPKNPTKKVEETAVVEKPVKKTKAPAETKFISSAGNSGRVKRFSL